MTKYKDGKISCELCNQRINEREIIIWKDESCLNPIDVNVFICGICDDYYPHEEIKEKIMLSYGFDEFLYRGE